MHPALGVAAAVRAFILRLAAGTKFFRRDLLKFGNQDAVDQALQRFKKSGFILHLTCGTYVRPMPGVPLPSIEEIAEGRITSFGRTGVPTAGAEARFQGVSDFRDPCPTYEVNASTSQFTIFPTAERPGCVVKLLGRVARKMRLNDSLAGKAIKALWFLGPSKCDLKAVETATSSFGRTDRAEFHNSHEWMPGWLSDLVHSGRRQKFRQRFV